MFVPDLPNVSLVAFYLNKPPELETQIARIQNQIQQIIPATANFIPYEIEQVHGTIIGCEGLKTDRGIVNKWFYQHRQEIRYLDIANLLKYFQQTKYLPITILFGGYNINKDYNFRSRNQHPTERSFQLQTIGNNTFIPVLMGWSFKDNTITKNIDRLRRDCQQFNLLHKYHGNPNAIDNDFYLRLGTIAGELTTVETSTIANNIKQALQQQKPTNITLDRDNLSFIRYQDLSLPTSTTEILPLTVATPSKIERLYSNPI